MKGIQNYCDFERDAVNATKKIVKEKFSRLVNFSGFELSPTFERAIISTIVNSADRFHEIIKNKNQDALYDALSERFKRVNLVKRTLGDIFIVRLVYAKLFNFVRYRQNSTVNCLVVVHHPKFVRYLLNLDFFANSPTKIGWLCLDRVEEIKNVLPHGAIILRPVRAAYPNCNNKFVESVLEYALSLEKTIVKIKPKSLVVCEGDAPYHSLISEIGKKYNIKSICFQWGVFYKTWREIAFSNMRFDYFLSWGEFFSNDLKPFNQVGNYIESGYPSDLKQNGKTGKSFVLFLGQGIGDHITFDDDALFVNLCCRLGNKFPGRIRFRPHPNMPLRKQQSNQLINCNVEILSSSESIMDQLLDCDVAVGISTSSLFEAILCDVVPICFNPTCTKGYHIPLKELEIGLETDDSEVGMQLITELITDEIYLEKFQRNIQKKKRLFFSDITVSKREKIILMLLGAAP